MGVKIVKARDILGKALDISKEKSRQVAWEGKCGRWEYRDNESLVFYDNSIGGYVYEVDLDRSRHAAATLDWIIQISKKRWASPECIGLLVIALDRRLGLQSNQCSWAMSSTEEQWMRNAAKGKSE